MLSSYIYWFVYRRRNKFLLLSAIVFCVIFYFYHNDPSSSTAAGASRQSNKHDKSKSSQLSNRQRINRETYTIPEPCKGDCPGENGQGVVLSVI